MNSISKTIFAAGCFWGVQYYFDQVPGVTKTTVGYTGGHTDNPSYEAVCAHNTGHAEALLIEFDQLRVNYETLCRQFFRMHDPTQLDRQGPDIGDQYRSAIFYFNNDQRQIAEMVKHDCQLTFKQQIVTEISPARAFYEAEDYHQKYTEKTGFGICHITYEPIELSKIR